MPQSYIEYNSGLTGTTFSVPFKYISVDDVHALGYDGTSYASLTVASRDHSAKTITLAAAPSAYQKVRVYRSTATEQLVDFQNGSRLSEADLDTAYQQGLFVAQEVSEDANTNQYVNLVDAALLANTSLSQFSSSSHTGDGTEVTFDLSFVPKTSVTQAFLVIIDGVLQSPVDAYTMSINPAQITFASVPPASSKIVVTTTAAATGAIWEDVYLFKDIPDIERATYTSPNLGTKALSETSIQASRGSAATPSSVSEPIIAFKKTSNYTGGEQNPTAVFLSEKRTQEDGARAQGVFIEAVDYAGFDGVGANNFVEGLRSHGIVGTGATNGSAYGAILFAGAESAVDWKYLIGAEGDVANNKDDAPSVDSFDRNNFCASFLATSGFGTKKVDAGFATNPFNTANTVFKTGFLVAEDSTDEAAFASRAATQIGLHLGIGSQSYASVTLPNNTPVRIKDSTGLSYLNCLSLSGSNELHLGSETDGCRMTLSGGYTDKLIEVGAPDSAGVGYRSLRIAN